MSENEEGDEIDSGEPVVMVQDAPKAKQEVEEKTKTRRQPPYNVILLNDEEHTFDYVIEVLMKVFAHAKPTAEELTLRIHLAGRAIVLTTHRELAELKQQQVHSYGPDPRMSVSKGPIACVLEATAG